MPDPGVLATRSVPFNPAARSCMLTSPQCSLPLGTLAGTKPHPSSVTRSSTAVWLVHELDGDVRRVRVPHRVGDRLPGEAQQLFLRLMRKRPGLAALGHVDPRRARGGGVRGDLTQRLPEALVLERRGAEIPHRLPRLPNTLDDPALERPDGVGCRRVRLTDDASHDFSSSPTALRLCNSVSWMSRLTRARSANTSA